jgi:hypothetical protein
LSFILSLFCALLATLVQQWSRAYIANAQRRGTPRSRGPTHAYLRVGVDRFGFNYAVDAIITLLHLSVTLFLAGLLIFLFSLNSTVANTALAVVLALSVVYLILTFLPFLSHDCPYRTPLTPVFRPLHKIMLAGGLQVLRLLSPRSLYDSFPPKDIWNAIYHYLLRAAQGRQHILALCSRPEVLSSGLQRPTYVLEQMADSLDENDEIYEFISSVPSYLGHLRAIDKRLEESLSRDSLRTPIWKLLESFDSRFNPAFTLTPSKTDQLVQLCLMAIQSGAQMKDTRFILPNRGQRSVTEIKVPQPIDDRDTAGHWYRLVDATSSPVVTFLAFCVLSPLYALEQGPETITDLRTFRKPHIWIIVSNGSSDALLRSLERGPGSYKDVYRLLLFIRAILHYATLPENPVAAHESIWLLILNGFCNRVMMLDSAYSFPDDALAVVWRVLSVVGRDDLLPYGAAGLPPGAPRLDYAHVFDCYPVLGGTLRLLVSAITPHRITHRVSAPALMQLRYGRPKYYDGAWLNHGDSSAGNPWHTVPVENSSPRPSFQTL